jgi:hypothetical protein
VLAAVRCAANDEAGGDVTRRDRAACVFALTLLRAAVVAQGAKRPSRLPLVACASDVLNYGEGIAIQIGGAFDCALVEMMGRVKDGGRYRRARLALIIRALLRADAGDVGPHCHSPRHPFREWRPPERLSGEPDYAFRDRAQRYPGPGHCGDCGKPAHVRITPLWEQATSLAGRGGL